MADSTFNIVGNLLLKVDNAEAGLNKLKSSLSKLELPKGLENSFKKSFSNLDGLFTKYKAQLKDGFNTKSDVTAFAKTGKQIAAEYDKISASISKITGKDVSLKIDLTAIQNTEKEIEKLITLKEKLSQDIKGGLGLNDYLKAMQASNVGRRGTKVFDASNMLQTSLGRGDITQAKADVESLISELNRMSEARKKALEAHTGMGLTQIIEALRTKVNDADQAMIKFEGDIKTTSDNMAQIRADQFDHVNKALVEAAGGADKLTSEFKELNGSAQQSAESMYSMSKQLQDLQTSTQYFFSLRNMINLFKRGVQEAVQVVKELDAAMTETAVVTDFSVSDMWAKLPEYTANAKALGATIQDMYESTTLYYQQGLNSQQAMGIATETMKMARIAGLEAKDATDMMTAALRGFNMELNEASATRINDVYSNLAAKTASDTEEIGTAMQRTASIAASAGMSFEGTAAFLAQAIETTREPAENIGTAMKTIVARFTEMKKNPLEITEVEGEEVSYNKIDTALQSIGVSLKDTNGQFRELDQVFLDISQRWSSLSQTQQRYIATVAAGSRQQSRFIAMMSNYDRTMELMEYANDSAGASQEQFGKTLDSLEAKLNKFKDAWQQFLMGIMNDSWTKKIVDGGTKILDTVNKIINILSGNGKLKGVKSFLSLYAAFTGLRVAGKGINMGIGALGGMLDPNSTAKAGLKAGAVRINDPSAISNPIVKAIHQLQIALTNKPINNGLNNNKPGDFKAFEGSYNNLRSLVNQTGENNIISLSKAYSKINRLDDRQQSSILGQMPALSIALKKKGITFKSSDIKDSAKQLTNSFTNEINKRLSNNSISTQAALKIFGTPKSFKTAMSAMGDEYAKAAEEILYSGYDEAGVAEKLKQQYLESGNDYSAEEAAKMATQAAATVEKEEYATRKLAQTFGTTIPQGALLAQKFADIGSKAMMAGQGIAQLGMQMSNAGFDVIGNVVTELGYKISSLGMVITSLGPVFATLKTLGNGSILAGIKPAMLVHPYITAAAAIITAITAVIGIIKTAEKRAQEAGQKVRESFEENFTKADEKIKSLEEYESRFNELAKGVDQFGHNVSLTTDEYNEYLSISRELKDLSPSLIAGYNAEGEAILKKGAAIQEVIDKLEEEKQAELDLYTSSPSIDKLIGEYKTSDTYSKYHQTENVGYYSGTTTTTSAFEEVQSAISNLNDTDLDFKLVDAVNQLSGWDLASLENLTTEQLDWVSKHYNDIINLVKEKNDDLDEEVIEGYTDAFSAAGVAIDEVMTEGQPIIDAMQMWMGAEGIDAVGLGLGEEFGSGFNEGFNAIMLQGLTEGWTSDEFKDNLQDYSKEWERLAGENSDYNEILTEAQEIQKTYLDTIGTTGAIDNYKESIEDSALALEQLAANADTSTAAGQAFAEQCIAQANALRNYATEGALSLGEALNKLSGKFAEARDAKERFDKAIEGGDYYTAAEGYRSIAETVMDEKNWAGDGSLAGWAGAEELLGRAYVDTHNWEEIKSQITEVNKLFEDGIEGVYNFNDMLVEAWNNGKIQDMGRVENGAFNFDFENVENLREWAEELEISEGVLSAMIDKSRQFAAFNTGNNKEIRHALEQTSEAMIGQTKAEGKSALYVSESYFYEEARRQGIRGNDYTKTKEDLTKEQNIQFLTVESLSTKEGFDNFFSDIGMTEVDKTLDNAVAILAKMGFSLEDTQSILTSEGVNLADGTATNEEIEQAYKEQEFAVENPTVAGIADNTSVIADAATAMLMQMGVLTEQAKADITSSTSEEALQPYTEESIEINSTDQYNQLKAQAESKLQELKATKKLLEDGELTDTAEYEAVQKAIELIDGEEGYLNRLQSAWSEATEAAKQYTEGIGNSDDQAWLSEHALEVQDLFTNVDFSAAGAEISRIAQEGNLSSEAINDLKNQYIALHAEELAAMNDVDFTRAMTGLGIYGSEIKNIRQLLQQPFSIKTQLTGADLKAYVEEIDALTNENTKSIILTSYVNNSEKVTDLINTINSEFGDGSEETKQIIIEATAKMANGDAAGAHEILQKEFGENTEEVETTLSLICDGSIANPTDVQNALSTQLEGLTIPIKPEIQPNIENIGKIGINVDQSAIEQARSNAESGATMPITADPSSFNSTTESLTKPGYKTINISPNFTGTWEKTLTVRKEEKKRGQNYSIPAHHTLSFGAAANGLNIPRKKHSSSPQMTALVGEEGFEVGYIPSESRSVIFGANGPEITSFPKDTVIYPHDKSKEIIRRGKGNIPTFGSFISGTLPSRYYSGSRGGSGGSSKSRNSGGSKSKTSKSNKNINNFSIEEVIRFDIDQTLEWLNSELKRREKDIETSLEKIGTVYGDITDNVEQQLAALKEIEANNKALADSYTRQLKAIDTGTYNEVLSWTNAKGKSQEATYNLAKYIYKDADGVYKADLDKIKALGSNAEREAVFKAVNSLVSSLQSGLIKAQEAADDARQQIEELGRKVSETFYQWENELTEIYDLTQRIDNESSLTERFMSQVELELSKLNAGFGDAAESIENTRKALARNNEVVQKQINDQREMIAARQRELDRMLSIADEQERIDRFSNATDVDEATKAANIAWAEDQKKIAETALKYVTGINRELDGSVQYEINWEGFNADNAESPLNKETYEAIKGYLDDLNDAAKEFNNSIKDQTDFIKDTYEALADYQKTVVSMEETLIKGVEEEIKTETDNAKKLSDSIRNQLKDLLDEVKRKLDERRKQEDNAKTERDISQKQQQLAMLRADTAGGNAVKIAQLEKEIADAQQSYQRTLEDQLLDRLQQQADEAAKQRERQIELAETANEIGTSTNKELVDLWLKNPEAYKEEIKKAWLEAQGFEEKGEAGQWALLQEFESEFTKLTTAVEQSGFNSANGIFTSGADGTLIEVLKTLSTEGSALVDVTERNTSSIAEYLKNLGTDVESIKDARSKGIELNTLQKRGIDNTTLKEAGYTARDFAGVGYNARALSNLGFSTNEIHSANTGETASELYDDNFSVKEISEILGDGLRSIAADDELWKKLSWEAVSKEAGFTVQDYVDAGKASASNLYQAGFSLDDIRSDATLWKNTSWTALRQAGYTVDDYADAGITYDQAIASGFTDQQLASRYDQAKKMINSPIAKWGADIKKGSNKTIVKKVQQALKSMGYKGSNKKVLAIDGDYGPNTTYAVKQFQKAMKLSQTGIVDLNTRKAFANKGYKTGGLADYTGLAWLDGTPSKPELVLNASDTKNFLALRDVLSSAMKSTSAVSNSYGGDVMYDINIHVDKIEKDYDVDRVVDKVKKEITKGAGYRNVTQVRNFR